MKTKVPIDAKVYLDELFYEFGKQRFNFNVSSAFIKDGQVLFAKWRTYIDCQGDELFIRRANQRSQLDNEINLEYDLKEGFFELIERLKREGIKFRAFATEENRARRIETFWYGLEDRKDRTEIRDFVIRKYGCDPQLKTDKHMTSFGKHFKTGKEIMIIDQIEGINELDIILDEYEKKKKMERLCVELEQWKKANSGALVMRRV